jgi:hypothetical protein
MDGIDRKIVAHISADDGEALAEQPRGLMAAVHF